MYVCMCVHMYERMYVRVYRYIDVPTLFCACNTTATLHCTAFCYTVLDYITKQYDTTQYKAAPYNTPKSIHHTCNHNTAQHGAVTSCSESYSSIVGFMHVPVNLGSRHPCKNRYMPQQQTVYDQVEPLERWNRTSASPSDLQWVCKMTNMQHES